LLFVADFALALQGLFQLAQRRLDQYTDAGKKIITYSATMDLSVFPAGAYSLQVNAIDFNTKHYAIERAQFEIR
jgi:hypothetical protein